MTMPRKPIPKAAMSQEEYQKKAEQFILGENEEAKAPEPVQVPDPMPYEIIKPPKAKKGTTVNYNFLLPKPLHKHAKEIAARLDITLAEYMIRAIQNENIKNSR